MEKKYWNLIVKHFTNEISTEEEKELNEWVSTSEDNKEHFNQAESIIRLSEKSFETYSPDTANEWKKLKAKIEGGATQNKVIPLFKKHWWKVAASILIILGAGYLFNLDTRTLVNIVALDSSKVFTLPDNSKIHLNKNSTLSYPENFAGLERNITLIGEAFFKVERDTSKPFVISAGNTQTKVLGTSFNLKAYEDDDEVELVVASGKVEFSTDDEKMILLKNDKVTYDKKKRTHKKSKRNNSDLKWWLKNIKKDVKKLFKKIDKKIIKKIK